MVCAGLLGLNLATIHIPQKMAKNKMAAHLDVNLQFLQYLHQTKLKLG
jgi:hypothetical protein